MPKQTQVERSFYENEIAPILPPKVLDFHTHLWSSRNWRSIPWKGRTKPGGTYMVTQPEYPASRLLSDGRHSFPDREYHAVCFGYPTPASDWEEDTAFVAGAARHHPNLHPLMLAGPALNLEREQYAQALNRHGFMGFKVFLNWFGNDYADIRVEDMVGPVEAALANERRLIVLLHVPRAGRLADPVVRRGVRRLADRCPDAAIVLAHCGRCYLPGEMKAGIGAIRNHANVYMDTSMVMDPVVLQIAINEIGPQRLLFGTDFPVAAMRGRRVRVKNHWVDVVQNGYPDSAFRVAGGIPAVPMAMEICLALRWAAEMTDLSRHDMSGVFWRNAMELLKRVRTP